MLQKTDARTLRLLDFAEFVDGLPDERIDVKHWCLPFTCETVGCYAGHAIYRYGTPFQIQDMEGHPQGVSRVPSTTAREILGLSIPQAFSIFYNFEISKQEVVALLRQWAFEEPQT